MHKIPIPAVKCKDFFADEIASNAEDGFFNKEFDTLTTEWICPNTEYMDMLNDSEPDSSSYSVLKAYVLQCE